MGMTEYPNRMSNVDKGEIDPDINHLGLMAQVQWGNGRKSMAIGWTGWESWGTKTSCEEKGQAYKNPKEG